MIVSHKHKFIFVHIHKCAGTAIGKALLPHLGDEDIAYGYSPELEIASRESKEKGGLWKHSPSWEIEEQVSKEVWDNYFKFSFIRSPWDIEVSLYHWWKKTPARWDKETKEKIIKMDFDEYILSGYTWEYSLFDFLLKKDQTVDQSNPKSVFAEENSASNIDFNVDFIGKYENLKTDFAYVCGRLNLPNIGLKQTNKSRPLEKRRTTREEYRSKEAIGKMFHKYYNDIVFFDYDIFNALGRMKGSFAYYCKEPACVGHAEAHHKCKKWEDNFNDKANKKPYRDTP